MDFGGFGSLRGSLGAMSLQQAKGRGDVGLGHWDGRRDVLLVSSRHPGESYYSPGLPWYHTPRQWCLRDPWGPWVAVTGGIWPDCGGAGCRVRGTARAGGAGTRLRPCPASGPGRGILLLDHSVLDARWLAGSACRLLEPALRRSESGPVGSAGPGRGLEPWWPGAGVACKPVERGDPRHLGDACEPQRRQWLQVWDGARLGAQHCRL
ncbi:hypothetical protein NDU88_005759 [Pleurodeles waltl]|uniref:Uncharacterized protein n=1 Tax=Pleurodeles waltl TaxID=8319 RepID=A0AAV7W8R3_PLEWA|nr:hypothetical protein NDU88_005759 [Pleurodeles waltl]